MSPFERLIVGIWEQIHGTPELNPSDWVSEHVLQLIVSWPRPQDDELMFSRNNVEQTMSCYPTQS